ncbi:MULTISPECIES: DUF1292 domain-containing protein [Loigolactobacillus]|uniref:UPF0473 protein AYR53_07415 n=2 Tax=Loigolactobacillus backii TaxID=375175 RepID=A0A192H3S6_9LACO|nr:MULTISPECIES: DUF1292 domain-containing protein [Loigolactobacillus]ANK59204.1 hypothetical protein AYR52_02300 [Loigolactobacillus backii]ANK62616.1 hypothetical protein AYR53_07415 [Loigolactobacillus backii]ANK64194.1 hypothetical protein AYR54_02295 [Loigolactobacillus backii]ANK67411.1 hypothetical protein AYR55_06740 [Loigolactobacillus backii]MDA5388039.1 DUF1292 domain-containing protein [Loigolactobacillus backii]
MANEQTPKNEDERQITLVDENGNEELYEILFTFDSDDFEKSYVLLYPAGTAEGDDVDIQAFSFKSNDKGDPAEGDLYPIESDKEWDMVEEVLNTFLADDDNDED